MSIEQLTLRPEVLNYEDLKKRCLGNTDFVLRVLGLLTDRGEADITQLEEAAERNDFQQVYEISHKLKGAFANAAATRMSNTAEELCVAMKSNQEDDALVKIRNLRGQWEELVSLIRTADTPS